MIDKTQGVHLVGVGDTPFTLVIMNGLGMNMVMLVSDKV
jgi:hypothetical protein